MRHRCEFVRYSELSHVHSWVALLTSAKSCTASVSTLKLSRSRQTSDDGEKIETPLIGLYDLGSRMLLQMIYFESWLCFSENKHKALHQRPWCQTQSFLVWKMWLLFNVETLQGYKEGKKFNSFPITKSLWGMGCRALTVSRFPDHITSQKGGSNWFTPSFISLLRRWKELTELFYFPIRVKYSKHTYCRIKQWKTI